MRLVGGTVLFAVDSRRLAVVDVVAAAAGSAVFVAAVVVALVAALAVAAVAALFAAALAAAAVAALIAAAFEVAAVAALVAAALAAAAVAALFEGPEHYLKASQTYQSTCIHYRRRKRNAKKASCFFKSVDYSHKKNNESFTLTFIARGKRFGV